jgi:branched-chain amino acid transport system substrate-binding protein
MKMKFRTILAVLIAWSGGASLSAYASDGVIKIGVLNDQSGPYASNSGPGVAIAAKMAVEDFGGTVLGKPIEVISADHQNKADIAAAITREWIDVQKVDALVDLGGSATALAALSMTRARNKILLLTAPVSNDFTGSQCSLTSFHWTYDSYSLANGTAAGVVNRGGDTWFFITLDAAGGLSMEQESAAAIRRAGGTVLGSVRHPLNNHDFSSFLLQAQVSNAKAVGLANAGMDTVNSIKQAAEFGLQAQGQKLAAILIYIGDIDAIGLPVAQGLLLTEPFYWDLDDKTRAWSARFQKRNNGRMPTSLQASGYSSVLHYLKAVQAAGTDDGLKVAKKMKEIPISDFFTPNGWIREDGRVIRDMYVFEVKSPAESSGRWDYYKLLQTIPGDQAFRPLAEGKCPLVK